MTHRRGSLWCFVLLAAVAGSMTPVHATGNVWIDPDGEAAATSDQGFSIDPNG